VNQPGIFMKLIFVPSVSDKLLRKTMNSKLSGNSREQIPILSMAQLDTKPSDLEEHILFHQDS
jgi:hypothetical protein